MMKPENVIAVNAVSKKFRVYLDKGYTLKEKTLFRKRRAFEERIVLDGLSFAVKKGEAVGLIGHNGCGKSTTLKLLAKIIYPDSGTIEMHGRVSSLIELGAGFHPDMSGRENIYINASIFGLSRKEIDLRMEDIIAFSELERFIDNPVRTYSSGMYMRLAFSVAIHVDADILLIDEILAVGDAGFQAKCFQQLKEIKAKGTTIVIVSHSLGQIEQICDRSVWIHEGRIQKDGRPRDVHPQYLDYMGKKRQQIAEKEQQRREKKRRSADNKKEAEAGITAGAQTAAVQSGVHKKQIPEQIPDQISEQKPEETKMRWGNGKARIEAVHLLDSTGKESVSFATDEAMTVQMDYKVIETVINAVFGIGIFRVDGVHCYGTNTRIDRVEEFHIEKDGTVRFQVSSMTLLPGSYLLDAAIESDMGIPVDFYREACRFEVFSAIDDAGVARLKHTWQIGGNRPALKEPAGRKEQSCLCRMETEEKVQALEMEEKMQVLETKEKVQALETEEKVQALETEEKVQALETEETAHAAGTEETAHAAGAEETAHAAGTEETVYAARTKEKVQVLETEEKMFPIGAEETAHAEEIKETAHAEEVKETAHAEEIKETAHAEEIKEKMHALEIELEKQAELLKNVMDKVKETECRCLRRSDRIQAQIGAAARQVMLAKWKVLDHTAEESASDILTCRICGHAQQRGKYETKETDCIFYGGHLVRYVCPECGVIFGPTKFLDMEQKEIDEDYEVHYLGFSEGDSSYKEEKAFFMLLPSKEGVYLNYGCGHWSNSMQDLREQGYQVFGYEPYAPDSDNPYMVTSREQLMKMRFDGIYSNDVLEHLLNPVGELAFMRSLLLHMDSRMAHSTSCYIYKYEYTRFHTHFFTGDSLSVMCERSGCRIVDACNEMETNDFICYVFAPVQPPQTLLKEMQVKGDGEIRERGNAVLRQGMLYGPYLRLAGRKYTLEMKLQGTGKALLHITAHCGQKVFGTYSLHTGVNQICFSLPSLQENVEFVIENRESMITVETIRLY